MNNRATAGALPLFDGIDLELAKPKPVDDDALRSRGFGIGAAMAGGGPAENRSDDDFYATPIEVIVALIRWLAAEGIPIGPRVWEPACGEDDIARPLRALGHDVVSTDLVYRGYGQGGIDFLHQDIGQQVDSIITNPPFDLAIEFALRALNLGPNLVAMMLKGAYWHSAKRHPIFSQTRPYAVLPLTWRPDFKGLGRPTMEVAWTVWLRGNTSRAIYDPLPRPRDLLRPKRHKSKSIGAGGAARPRATGAIDHA